MALVGARIGRQAPQPRSTLADGYLNAVARKVLVIRRVLATYGDTPLRDYVFGLLRFSAQSCQDRTDLLEVVRDYSTPLLGEAVAERVANDLARTPIALTANHHGVDFFAQSIQSNLMFSLRELASGDTTHTVPVFACGSVPLNNITFPRGLLLYAAVQSPNDFPTKLPIFPDRYKRDLVSNVRAFDQAMLDRAEHRAERFFAGGGKNSHLQETTSKILRAEFAHPQVLERSTYSDQAVTLNHRIWKRLFQDATTPKDLVYLELEKVAAHLLCRDLANDESLAFRVFFDGAVRESILETLDGHRACWDLAALHHRIIEMTRHPPDSPPNTVCGTVFFWGIDERKRRIPLVLVAGNEPALVGVGERGERQRISFSAEALCEGLSDGILLPALFTSYLAIALARGVTCLGGYYQAGYLPVMQRAVVEALQGAARYTTFAERVAGVPTNAYLSGMQAVMTRVGDDTLAPAGVLEIMAGGGLTSEDVERIGGLSVRSAHLASIVETVLDVTPGLTDSEGWFARVGTDLHNVLRSQVVVK